MREIVMSATFMKELSYFLKLHKDIEKRIPVIFEKLKSDIHTPSLRTHKLHGKLGEYYACNISHNYRVVFRFDSKCIYPQSIGSHDDVY